jgi:hypothetical protein
MKCWLCLHPPRRPGFSPVSGYVGFVVDKVKLWPNFNDYLRRMVSSGMLRRVALVRTDLSDELSASFIMVTKIDELASFVGC